VVHTRCGLSQTRGGMPGPAEPRLNGGLAPPLRDQTEHERLAQVWNRIVQESAADEAEDLLAHASRTEPGFHEQSAVANEPLPQVRVADDELQAVGKRVR